MTATGNNYSQALFMLACEENSVDEFYQELMAVKDVFDRDPEYLQFLSTPSIPKSERTAAISQAFDGRINEYVVSFLQLLCEHGKAETFNECVSEYERLREWASGTTEAVVKTAVELTKEQKSRLASTLGKHIGKNVIIKTVIQPDLLGGVQVELDGQLLDGSLKNNLKRAREVIGV